MEGIITTIIAGIDEDISDRSGIGDEWDYVDDDVKKEIFADWSEIIRAALKAAQEG